MSYPPQSGGLRDVVAVEPTTTDDRTDLLERIAGALPEALDGVMPPEESVHAAFIVAERIVNALCNCYPFGVSPSSFDGPHEDCTTHGRTKPEMLAQRQEGGVELARAAEALRREGEVRQMAEREVSDLRVEVARLNAELTKSAAEAAFQWNALRDVRAKERAAAVEVARLRGLIDGVGSALDTYTYSADYVPLTRAAGRAVDERTPS